MTPHVVKAMPAIIFKHHIHCDHPGIVGVIIDYSELGEEKYYPLNQGGLPMVFFDFGDYIRKMTTEEEYNSFKKLLDRVVIYKAATEKLFGDEVPADKFSGLTSYIPFSEWSDMNTYYYTLDWGATVYENN